MSEKENDRNIFFETLSWICGILEAGNIPYMITGGTAVGFWGQIRTTMDIDIVIQIYANQIESFLKCVENDTFIDKEEIRKEILEKRMVNLIFKKTCFKVDLIPFNAADSYENEKFGNRVKLVFQNKEMFVISPEDLIISKLVWSKSAGGSERQLRDAESIFKLNHDKLNLDYINKWVKLLCIEDEFNKVVGT